VCPGTDDSCTCHPVVEGNDWFPTSELSESVETLRISLVQKFGINIESLLSGVSPGSFRTYSFTIPSFATGYSSYTVDVDYESIFERLYGFVSLIRSMFTGMIWLVFLRVVMYILFRF
jgi:hypothetical protein